MRKLRVVRFEDDGSTPDAREVFQTTDMLAAVDYCFARLGKLAVQGYKVSHPGNYYLAEPPHEGCRYSWQIQEVEPEQWFVDRVGKRKRECAGPFESWEEANDYACDANGVDPKHIYVVRKT